MASISLKKAFNSKTLPKRLIVNVQIIGFLAAKKLKILDSNQGSIYYLDISDAQGHMTKYFEIGKAIKIINPLLKEKESTLAIEKRTIVANGIKIEGLEIDSEYVSVSSTFEMDQASQVPGKIIAKVVNVTEPKHIQKKFGPRIKYMIDINDTPESKQTLDMWRQPYEKCCVEVGKVYIFPKLTTGNFPPEKPHYLVSSKDFNITLASLQDQKNMEFLEYADGKLFGKVLAIHSASFYKSCNNCKCNIQNSSFKIVFKGD